MVNRPFPMHTKTQLGSEERKMNDHVYSFFFVCVPLPLHSKSSRSRAFLEVDHCPDSAFGLYRGLKQGYYSQEEVRGTYKGKISARINRCRVIDYSSEIFLAHSSLGKYLPSELLAKFYNWKNVVKPDFQEPITS